MSIIHEALKKVQRSMNSGNKNPEDIVEILPSQNTAISQKPKGSGLRSFLTILACLIVLAISVVLGFRQIQHHAPQLLTNTPFANQAKLQQTIDKAIEKTPISGMIKPLNKPKTNEPKHLAQIKIPAEAPLPAPTTTTTAETEKPAPTTTETPQPSENNQAITNTPPPLELNIQGIMSNGTNNVALINNAVYEEGSVIEGIKILKITLQAITIERNGEEEIIPVKK